jgi:ATP-dependent Lon protease
MTAGATTARAREVFAGKVVRKDLVRKVKVGANVPVYVLEYLLGKYCATDDPAAIDAGLRVVNSTVTENFVRPDEANRAQFRLKDDGRATFIDKIRVRALEDKDWAELSNFGNRYLHIPDHLIRQYPRLLEGGIWAQVDLEYRPPDDDEAKARPFYVTAVRPIQLASFDFAEYIEGRAQLTTEEWLDLVIRSIGLEPELFTYRLKLLFLTRLIPMVERNYNFVELGPRGTGKSFVYREVSPYSILVSGGRTTVANLFFNMATNKMGLVGLWDVVAFDEVAGLEFSDKTAVQILKDYMEAGSFSRGKDELVAEASMAFLGNTNAPIEVLVRSSHLFQPLPEAMQDMALIDRFHFYLPGWEVPKMATEHFTGDYGFVVDYIAEAFRELRKHNFTDVLDRHFSLGSHLNARDAKAVRKTVSGLVKLLHPDRDVAKDELRTYLELAIEGRRRVKEQLKKMGAFEYYQTSFSYLDSETREEHFVGVPEQGGQNLISPDPLPPGSVYGAAVGSEDRATLFRVEVSKLPGSGRLRVSGSPPRAARDSLITAFDFMRSRAKELGLSPDLDQNDYHAQLVGLGAGENDGDASVPFFVALYSLLKAKPVLPALIIIGGITIHGNLSPVRFLTELLQNGMDNGARRVVLPTESKRQFLEVPGDVVEKVDPIFYSDALTAAAKALGMS